MKTDGLEFVVGKLTTGSVLNQNNVLLETERMFMTVKCSSRAHLEIITILELLDLASTEKEMFQKITHRQNKLIKQQKQLLLDYLPGKQAAGALINPDADLMTSKIRKIKLQNVVMQIIKFKRLELFRPSLFQIV